jgi:hypothetical protein
MTALQVIFAVVVAYSTMWRLSRLDALRFYDVAGVRPWWRP